MERRTTRAALAAKAIRQELKVAFPGIKFKVTSENYSGGSSVNVSWVNGPTTDSVEIILDKYEYGTFDGMTDSSGFKNSDFKGPQVKFLFCTRKMTDDVKAQILKDLNFASECWNAMGSYEQEKHISRNFESRIF